MRTFLFIALTALMAAPAAPPAASAHPAPFEHHHARRPPPPPPPPSERRRPRRPVERRSPWPVFYLGFGGLGNVVEAAGDSEYSQYLEPGGGFDLFLGWRFTQHAGLDLSWTTTFHDAGESAPHFDDGTLSMFTADVRIYLLPEPTRIEPFANVGMGFYALSRDDFYGSSLTGPGLQAGGGVDIHLTPHITLGGKLLYRGAHLENRDAAFGIGLPESDWFHMFTYEGSLRFNF
ncbi:MAG: outer membrane beta-barrel protein [Myxococcota bacterium]